MVGALRNAVVGVAMAAIVLVAMPQLAQGAVKSTSTTTTTAMTTTAFVPVAISFAGTATDGTPVELTAHVTEVILSRLSESDPGVSPGGPGSDFLNVDMTTDESAGSGPSFNGFDAVPATGIQLALPGGTTVGAQAPGQDLGFLVGTYSFVVPASTTSGNLEVTPGTVSAVEYPGAVGDGGALTHIAFQPSTASIVVPPPTPITVPTTVPATTEPVIHAASPQTKATTGPKRHKMATGIAPAVTAAGAAGGGLVVLLLVIPVWRRRAYVKADWEGRVIIDSPPVPRGDEVTPAVTDQTNPAQSNGEVPAGLVTVKILGPLEVDGLLHPLKLSPERELLVFLALHPGRRFTSTELRSAIWVVGRDEPKAQTLRNYLTSLNRALPPGAMVKEGLHHSLSEAITSDWTRFCALVATGPIDWPKLSPWFEDRSSRAPSRGATPPTPGPGTWSTASRWR